MIERFPPIAANPYSWPFDGEWTPSNTALLILGFQTGMVAALEAQAEALIVARLAAAARAREVAVMATRRGAAPQTSEMAARRMALGDVVEAPGTPRWQLEPSLGLATDDPVLDHSGDNAFFGTDLEARLRLKGVRNLVLAGLPTEGLLHATMRAANDMGFECLAVSDACKGTSEERHRAQLRITTFGNGLFGGVCRSNDLLHAFS
jgi:biuret amidohydrolase